jgi:hypothetical protein
VFLIIGAIFSVYTSDILGCLIDENQIPLINLVTFTSIFSGTIIGAAILKMKYH